MSRMPLGSRKWDVDGHELIDFLNGHGALLLGHSPPEIVAAVQEQVAKGTHYGACHELEIEWGECVKRLLPSAERVRFTSSGTEATLHGLAPGPRVHWPAESAQIHGPFPWLARLRHAGAYPPYDSLDVPGLPGEIASQTVVIPPNDLNLVEQTLAGDLQIGAVILEPTGGHWGAVPVRGEFLRGLQQLTRKHGQLLIFDEVITGFRVHPGGAQAHYGIQPDLTTLAKILAAGCRAAPSRAAPTCCAIEIRPASRKLRHPGTYKRQPTLRRRRHRRAEAHRHRRALQKGQCHGTRP